MSILETWVEACVGLKHQLDCDCKVCQVGLPITQQMANEILEGTSKLPTPNSVKYYILGCFAMLLMGEFHAYMNCQDWRNSLELKEKYPYAYELLHRIYEMQKDCL